MQSGTKIKLSHQLIELLTFLDNAPDNRCLAAKELDDLKSLIDRAMRSAARLYVELEFEVHDKHKVN